MPGLRVVAAPNAFKGSLDAAAAAAALCAGVLDADPAATAVAAPMADGGDGTAAVLAGALGGTWQVLEACDPWGTPRPARFALLADGTAVLDLAAASGIGRLRPGPEQALAASTGGSGTLVRAALAAGARRLVVALGGSATTDGGAGILRALGARLLDGAGGELPPGGAALSRLAAVDLSALPALPPGGVVLLVDVRNPLLGPEGAATVFAPQKGADAAGVRVLEAGLRCFADVLEAATGRRWRELPGAGAAGGTGFGLAAALGAEIRPGADAVASALDLRGRLRGADLCLTGEGALDAQTAYGKAPAAVAAHAAATGVPVVALCGALGPGHEQLLPPEGPLQAALAIAPGPRSRAQALAHTAADLRRVAAAVTRLFAAGRAGA